MMHLDPFQALRMKIPPSARKLRFWRDISGLHFGPRTNYDYTKDICIMYTCSTKKSQEDIEANPEETEEEGGQASLYTLHEKLT